ncbi:MAG TPA: bile acid:sodium symporter [Acidimicrobiales bacterium]|nr:bile acid:sodium symporter [Acidimicrobiales bacterium]
MQHLERHQVWLYLSAITAGLALGLAAPSIGDAVEVAVWPSLGLLLYVTFLQMPLAHVPGVVRDARFVITVLVTNFAVLPVVVWALLPLAPDDPAVRLGVVLVLVMPCTDWFLTFSHLGGGDTRRALAVTPVLLAVQLFLLPVYVRVLVGESFGELTGLRTAVTVFVTLIVVPLVAAWVTQRRAERHEPTGRLLPRLSALPVVLVATVVFLIAASQASVVTDSVEILGRVGVIYLGFLVAALVLGRGIAAVARLEPPATRTLIFSAGTRNSFVVLPLALALPGPWSAAAVVVVFQSLVELLGIVVYLRVVPRIAPGRRNHVGTPPAR